MDLPLFERAGPFAHLPLDCHLPESGEWLDEERPSATRPACPADELAARELAKWDRRRAKGDASPKPGCWGEYRLTLDDGTPVAVVVEWPWISEGGMAAARFYGDVSPTGYHSRIFHRDDVQGEFGAWLRAVAEERRRETIEEWEREQAQAAGGER